MPRMSNHPNRSKARTGPGITPTPEQVRELRSRLKLTQTEAAAVVYFSMRAWQEWEAGERRMLPAVWELFRAKTGTLPYPLQRLTAPRLDGAEAIPGQS